MWKYLVLEWLDDYLETVENICINEIYVLIFIVNIFKSGGYFFFFLHCRFSVFAVKGNWTSAFISISALKSVISCKYSFKMTGALYVMIEIMHNIQTSEWLSNK